jgi:hypothetical protein
MERRLRYISVCLLVAIPVLLGGCASDPNEGFIQGNWHYVHQRMKPVYHNPGEDIIYWTFDRGVYTKRICCLHNDYEDGRYRVVQVDENSITLELFEGRSLYSEGRQIKIVIDRDKGTLRINRDGPFVRSFP